MTMVNCFIEIIETNEFQDRKPGKQPTGPWRSRTFTLTALSISRS